MEKCFIISPESELAKDYKKYKEDERKQIKFVNEFFNEKNIEAEEFMVRGNGFVNMPFSESDKLDICLSIEPTEKDIERFGKTLTKPNKNHGLCSFKKNSCIAKEFAQKCVEEKIVINLWKPRLSDYFKSLGHRGCNWEMFKTNEDHYLKVESDYLGNDDVPEGLTEIKQSEYYKIKEELEMNNK